MSEFWNKFLSDRFDRLKRTVRRKFPNNPQNGDEALSFVSERLVERLKRVDPTQIGDLDKYLGRVVANLIIDYHRKNDGRFIPPKALLKTGNMLFVKVYQYLCRDRMRENDVEAYLSDAGGRNPRLVREAILTIRDLYPDCGMMKNTEIPLDDDIIDDEGGSPHETRSRELVTKLYQAILDGPDDDSENGHSEINAIKDKLRGQFKPKPKERLFLMMVYQDGMSVEAAGKNLGWSKSKTHYRKKKLMDQLNSLIGKQLRDLL